MTFEATRKKQVLVLQPRGKALYEDDSSFGSKMLAKMGWSKGKGLGKEQHGNLDFIQIRYKNNANGLGYDGLKDNQWTENESQFDNLLKTLNGKQDSNSNSADEQQSTSVVRSLEEKSKLSRARVHYKKFTRGKDVHKYSEKELANILGKKTLAEAEVKPEEVAEIEDDKPCVYDSNLIVNTGLSVTDYFKQKMQAKCQPFTEPTGDNSEKQKKKNKRQMELEETVVNHQEELSQSEPSKKKKRKRVLDEAQEGAVEQVLDESEEPPKKSKKSKKKRDKDSTADSVAEQPQETNEEPLKKSKKKLKSVPESPEIVQEDLTEEAPKKSKKKSKSVKEEESLAPESSQSEAKAPPKRTGEPDRPTGANAVYSTNVIQIPSHVAQKMSNVTVDRFKNSNIANIVGYGLSEDIEMKIVQTKVGDNSYNTDKYSLYNMDRLTTRQKVNPRKIMSKIKRTKKSIQVI